MNLVEEIEQNKQKLLELLNTWYYYKTDILQKIFFDYENLFGDIESRIKDHADKLVALEYRYELLKKIIKNGDKATKETLKFIDKLVEKETKRKKNNPNKNFKYKNQNIYFGEKEELLNVVTIDINVLYRQIAKRLHPDIIGDNVELRKCWDNMQICYQDKDLERMNMFYLLFRKLDNEYLKKNQNDNLLHNDLAELKNEIKKQENALIEIKNEEPFCFENKLNDKNWQNKRKEELQERLYKIHEQILHLNKIFKNVLQ